MKVMIKLPFEGPWEANREGMVKAATGERLGYTRFENLGMTPNYQAVSRFWAASPCLATALATLVAAGDATVRAAVSGGDVADAAITFQEARAQAIAALQRLYDPMIARNIGINVPVSAALERLQGGK
ncbi:hypothetical protein [Microvirga terricola]|uniref:Uncharacterized protein n=1 Tax=Microvirga terricola TaxID=2719797 RepID=A0ABX0V880_9HYPH|nr:hypothetical protein [Microvirga terricola]NIX75409.1 hypothetical protein [Microvirga terricola]